MPTDMTLPAPQEPGTDTFRGPAMWRSLLDEQWRHHVAEITRLSVELCDLQDVRSPDAPYDGTREDQIQVTVHLITSNRQALSEIEAALSRLTAGGFGHCEQCGTPIPPERLEVLPHTRYCVRCQPGRQGRR